MLEQFLYLLAAQASSFLIQPPFPNKVSQDTFSTLQLTAQYFCDLRDSMPRHWATSTSNHSILQKRQLYQNTAFILYKHSFKNILYCIYLYTNLFLKIYYSSSYSYSR